MSHIHIPQFRGDLRKNDALFMYGATSDLPFVHVYEQPVVEVVHGPSCRISEEIYADRCRSDDINITERRGGGGTVVLSPGMLVTVIVGNRKKEQSALDIFNLVHNAFITVLDRCGVDKICPSGISDLAMGNKKVLGSSLYMGRDPMLFYYQSSLMVNPDLALLEKYLKHPPREPDYRKGREHKEFCTSLCEQGYSGGILKLENELGNRLPEILKVDLKRSKKD